MPAGEIAERIVEAGLGQDDADVGERGLREHAGDVTRGERGFQRGDIVERDHDRRLRNIDLRTDVAVA